MLPAAGTTRVESSAIVRAAAGLLLIAGLALGIASGLVRAAPPPDSADGDDDPAVLAVAGQQHVTISAFRRQYTRYLTKTGQQDRPRLRHRLLRHMINERLVAQAMVEAGVTEEEGYRREVQRTRRSLLLDLYAQRVLFDTLQVSEAELREMFYRSNTELKARHLYAHTLPHARELRERLRRGASFEGLAREVFADTALARSGGSLGWFSFDEMDPAFEDAAYALDVGEISDPVRTAQGYSIIQLTGQRTKPILTETEFGKKQDELRIYARRRQQTRARSTHLRHLADTLNPRFHTQTLDRLLAHIRGTALLPQGENAKSWRDRPLVSFGEPDHRRTWTIADFRKQARLSSEKQRAKVRSREHLRGFITGLIVREEMLRRARSAGLDQAQAFQDALIRSMQQWLHQEGKRRVRKAIRVSEDSLRAYFAAHRKRFEVPTKVRVREILVETKKEASALKKQLQDGTSFAELARMHSQRPGAEGTGGDLGFVSREQLGRLAEPVFAAQPGSVLGPVEIAGRYALLKVGEKTPQRLATFAEARDQIEKRLRRRAAKKQLADYYDRLRRRYEVDVNAGRLQALSLTTS